MEGEKYLKTNEVAKILGVNRKTIQRWAENGILPPVHKTGAGYNLYSQLQIAELCQTATNLLATAKNCDKSLERDSQTAENLPTIKNRTAQNLQNAVKEFAEPEPEKKPKSVRIIPTKMLVMPNDKLTKELFTLPPEKYINVLENGGLIIEKKLPKIGEILPPYWLEFVDNYNDKSPLTMFAKAVFTACVSEWVANNKYTTDGIIFRHITGKPRGSNAQPTPAIRDLILFCIRKMMCTVLRVDMTEVCKQLNYNNGVPLILNSPILPCKYVEEVINGQKSRTVIYFLDESPLLTIARVKNNQLLSFEPRLLNILNQANSSKNISVRHCVIQRVLECIVHKEMKRKIKFNYIFEVCGLINVDAKKKCEVIQEVIDIFECLQSGGDIQSFIVKRDGDEYDCIKFILN